MEEFLTVIFQSTTFEWIAIDWGPCPSTSVQYPILRVIRKWSRCGCWDLLDYQIHHWQARFEIVQNGVELHPPTLSRFVDALVQRRRS